MSMRILSLKWSLVPLATLHSAWDVALWLSGLLLVWAVEGPWSCAFGYGGGISESILETLSAPAWIIDLIQSNAAARVTVRSLPVQHSSPGFVSMDMRLRRYGKRLTWKEGDGDGNGQSSKFRVRKDDVAFPFVYIYHVLPYRSPNEMLRSLSISQLRRREELHLVKSIIFEYTQIHRHDPELAKGSWISGVSNNKISRKLSISISNRVLHTTQHLSYKSQSRQEVHQRTQHVLEGFRFIVVVCNALNLFL